MSFNTTSTPRVGAPRLEMSGSGAPKSTIYGVIGKTKMDPLQRSLGGLIYTTTAGGRTQHGTVAKVTSETENTDRHILGAAARTHVPGQHYGMVPYAGHYRSALGAEVS